MGPDAKERRPPGRKAADHDVYGDGNVSTTIRAPGDGAPGPRPRRCTFLHPSHLTGCRQPAEPGLGVHFTTVRADLAEWDKTHPNQTSMVAQNQGQNVPEICRLGDFRTTLGDLIPGSADAVITDPPYPREFLPLWSDLAEHAANCREHGGET